MWSLHVAPLHYAALHASSKGPAEYCIVDILAQEDALPSLAEVPFWIK